MSDNVQTVVSVIQNLKNLFKDKDRLVGFEDWDNFLGCLVALEGVVNALQQHDEETAEE